MGEKTKKKGSISYAKWGYIFIAPFFIIFAVFQLIPLASTIYYSFFEYYRSGLKIIGPSFVGLKNYITLFATDLPKYFSNTLILWIIGFVPQIIVSLLLAAWFTDLRLKLKGQTFFKTVIYMPNLIMASAFAMLFFALFSTDNWKIMSLIWAILPIVNAVMFTRVPIAPVVGEDEEKLSIKDMLKTKAFWIFMVLILCAGSSEQAVSQWASTFAEKALGLTKTVGDLAGPMLFSILMGVSRFMYGKFGNRINLDSMMLLSGCVCTASYFLISLTSSPILGLVGVAVCGLSAGILWPGTIGKMSSALHGGGTAMYAILCLGGDIGCSAGPTFAGMMASFFGDDLKKGILCAVIFPLTLSVIMLVREFIIPRRRRKANS